MRAQAILRRTTAIAVLAIAVGACAARTADGTVASSSSIAASPSVQDLEVVLHWPAPSDPLERTVAAGLMPDVRESQGFHAHAHLDVFIDGKPMVVPAGIGINVADPAVHRFDKPDGSVEYGDIERCDRACISPLHTHSTDGILHTESASTEPNTLGQFFAEWGVGLSETCVGEYCPPTPIAIFLNGERYTGDPGAIELTDRLEIAIVIGTPPPQIPSTADFSKA